MPAAQDSAKRVLVTVREAPFREVQLGVGFNTIEFVQMVAIFPDVHAHLPLMRLAHPDCAPRVFEIASLSSYRAAVPLARGNDSRSGRSLHCH